MEHFCQNCTDMWGVKKFVLRGDVIEEEIYRFKELSPEEQKVMIDEKKDNERYKCQDCRKRK